MSRAGSAFGASPQGAEARGPEPTCVGLDRLTHDRGPRPCGLQGTPAAGQSPIRGACLVGRSVARSAYGWQKM